MIDELLDITEFKLFDINNERANVLASEVGPQIDAEIAVHNVPATTVESDAVVTVTDSKSPVLEERKLNDVGLVIALGSYRELSDETIHAADQVVVDHIDQCLQRGALADLASRDGLTRDDIAATIGEVLNNGQRYPVGSEDRMLFVPIGLGSLDVAIAEHVRRNTATNRNSIHEFDFE